MKKLRTIYTADIPDVGELVFSEVSDAYAEKTAKAFESFEYESFVIDKLRSLDYDIFIDIGAAFGYFSLIAASLGKEVLAVEPHPIRFGYLWWNTNKVENIEILPYFVGTVNNRELFTTNDIGGLYGMKVGTRVPSKFTPQTILLSDLYYKVGFTDIVTDESLLIKIDVEGFEEYILLYDDYIKDMLENSNVKWIIEIHPNLADIDKILELFKNHTQELIWDREGGTKTYLFYRD